jgi:mRNA-degrading endonuclease RelE of RelBE toxin-antitoxin system
LFSPLFLARRANKSLLFFASLIKKLKNHEYGYRLRVGDWRILFNAFEEIEIVSIEEVKKRDEHTY